MAYKLFLDDERYPVDDTFIIARNKAEFFGLLDKLGFPEFMQLDHDLGPGENAYQIITELTDLILDGVYIVPENFSFHVHSQNPIGAANLTHRINNLLKYLKENGNSRQN